MSSCTTVKSADDESYKTNSFVSYLWTLQIQKLEVNGGWIFYMYAENNKEKEEWIGALGRAMVKETVLMDDDCFDHPYM